MSGDGNTNPLARLAALVAVIFCVVAVGLVFATSLGGSSDEESVSSGTSDEAVCDPEADAAVDAGYFTVNDPEDIVTVISDRTCVDEATLNELNPDLDANALALGTCINLDERLRCKKVED